MYQKKNFFNAAEALSGIIKQTPLLWSKELNETLGFNLYLKAECLQRTGSFKLRGAYYCMHQEFVTRGKRDIVAFSSGNHAQGVALAAKLQNVKATIVMPTDAPDSKINNTKALGANVIFYDRYNESREEIAEDFSNESGAFLIPAYDHFDVICGQGTVGMEAFHQMANIGQTVDRFYCPVGGGGLIAGSSSALNLFNPDVIIIGVEPESLNDTQKSFSSGKREIIKIQPDTLCDSLMAEMPGELTFRINQSQVSSIDTVTDQQVIDSMSLAFHEFGIIVEPGGAASLAAVLSAIKQKAVNPDENIVAVLSGGNISKERHRNLIN
ncbi:MAG: threonine/serine dehydratase [Pseudomonadota bacterium]|nr:threonine/serine dehydratase [Pseudomonadota bacterium]